MRAGTRVLFAGDFWPGCTEDGLAAGLSQQGFDVCRLDRRPYFLHGPSKAIRIAARLIRPVNAATYNQAIVTQAVKLQPAALVTVKGAFISAETIAQLKSLGITTINFYPDVHFAHPGLTPQALAAYDLFYSSKLFHVAEKSKTPRAGHLEHLDHGYVSQVHRPRSAAVAEQDYAVDCVYLGNYSPSKAQWLEGLRRALPSLSLAIYGDNWASPTRGTSLEPYAAGYPLLGDAYARALETARITLAMHYGPTSKSRGWEDEVSTRTFEIPACKGFMLHIDNPTVRQLFEVGTEIDVFSSPEELAEKVKHYLARPDLRRAMIDRAYARCVPAYSYDERAKVIGNAIAERLHPAARSAAVHV